MRAVLLPSIRTRGPAMGWPLQERDIKRYPHFDAPIPLDELTRIATDPKRVAQHPFLPFLLYYKRWQPFRRPDELREKKKRPIRYASRIDSAIFSYYRFLLSSRYEAALQALGLQDCVIAYRKVSAPDAKRGKCNIDFAAQAFSAIRSLGTCCAVTLDISSYFESIDHALLRAMWCELLGVDKLPPDHAAIFRAITRSAVVDRQAAYERLGYIAPRTHADGSTSIGYTVRWRDMPRQLCAPVQFRQKICGDGGLYPNLVTKNEKRFGIPQGIPISDLLANLYLLHFDERVAAYVRARDGKYYRYSDDIFIVVPGREPEGRQAALYVRESIREFGQQLKINDKKTAIVCFEPAADGLLSSRRMDRSGSTEGLDYLGFRFDGRDVYIRNSTISRLYRNITFAARRRARRLVRRYTGKGFEFLLSQFDIRKFESRYGKVADFDPHLERKRWTFRTYVKRCAEVFGDTDGTFFRQIRRHREFIRKTVEREIVKALNPRVTGGTTISKSGREGGSIADMA